MTPRVLLMFAVLATAGLAGCAQDDVPVTMDDDFDDVDVEVTSDTGAIRGLVINDAIIPVADVEVSVLNTPLKATTDDQGRFAFSKVPPGTYFLAATKPLHQAIQTTVEVKAGVVDPPIIRIQMARDFKEDPYMQTIPMEGFFTCSQAGGIVWGYSSSPCHSFSYGGGIDLCDSYGTCLEQERVFHSDVGQGWQAMIFEMTWEQSAYGTSEMMGMSVSTYHPERNKNHWFASVDSANPMYFRINVTEMHATAQEGSGPDGPIPTEGMKDMSVYMSVRKPGTAANLMPGLSIDQDFQAYLTQFYYAPPPVGWSFMRGDPSPY